MSYISLSLKDKEEMLKKLGVSSVDELFSMIPDNIKLAQELQVPTALSEPELIAHFEKLAAANVSSGLLSFLGAGAYSHHIPVIVDYLSSRGEFVSPYTPYQPEVSQGTLQIIFEFQTLICQLTGMDLANASLYDGASGAAEAALMANRIKRKKKILVSSALNPQYREVIRTYTKNLEVSVVEIGYLDSGKIDLEQLRTVLDDDTAAVLWQSPNFFGVIENGKDISELVHEKNALSIAVVSEAVSLGLLEPPGENGADIVTGEAQSFGIPLSFGGPYLGFMACAQEYIRQLPGRIAGKTKDIDGKDGYVLTLSTREQHIRRERATSNICTNQALCMVRAVIFLETLGLTGLQELAQQNVQKAGYARQLLGNIKGVETRFTGPCFNEFVLQFPRPWSEIKAKLEQKNIIGGLGLEAYYPELTHCALFCITEKHRKTDIDTLANTLEEILV